MHLFDVDIKDRIKFVESERFSPGNKPCYFETEFGRVGLGICYDLRFPEIASYYSQHGCSLLVYPAAFSQTTGQLHLELLTRARALDNQVFLAVCSATSNPHYKAWGHSIVTGPMGEVLARGGGDEEIITVELDFDAIKAARESIPVLRQKRYDLYNKVEFHQ